MRRLIERYRVQEASLPFTYAPASDTSAQGFFRFGKDALCYGGNNAGRACNSARQARNAGMVTPEPEGERIRLSFDPDQIVDNLLLERYPVAQSSIFTQKIIRPIYYLLRPVLPVSARKRLQKAYLSGWDQIPFPNWPLDCTVEAVFEELLKAALKTQGCEQIPFIWFWPEEFQGCLILTHDVETAAGRDFCSKLMDLDDSCGFKSSFQVVPEKRYEVPQDYIEGMRRRGFEVNVHDLTHDGYLFSGQEHFKRCAELINHYGKKFGSSGFRSGVMYRNPDWLHYLDMQYDMSFPNIAHLDPQRGGCCTVLPYFIGDKVELPLTTTQDYALFHFLQENSICLWETQVKQIIQKHGLISVLTHPDYIMEEQSQSLYMQFLRWLKSLKNECNLWASTPAEVNTWWRERNGLRLAENDGQLSIQGTGSERASIAYATLENDKLVYRVESSRASAQRAVSATTNGTHYVFSTPEQALTVKEAAPQVDGEGTWARRPLRIGMVAHTQYQSDNRVMRYAETLAARGDHVDVFALRSSEDEPDVKVNGVNVYKIQTRNKEQKGRVSYLIPILRFLLHASWKVGIRGREQRYDLIHVHSVPDFLVLAAWLPKLTGTRVILDIHDILPEFYASKFDNDKPRFTFRLLLMVEKVSARLSDHVIIANDIWRKRLISRSVGERKCTSILNFPDRSIFHPSGRTRTDDRFVMLYPGSLNHHQGLDIAIRALAKIRDQAPKADLHILGQGPEKQKLINLVHELGLEDRVQIKDLVPLREVVTIMENADAGIVPKRSDSFGNEAFSTKTLEFMSLGVPLIVADTTIDKYYYNDDLVRFFRSGDVDDLAAAMLELSNNPELRRKLSVKGLEYACNNDWEHYKDGYLNMVDSLVAGREVEL
jgi:glycosyltransferase involved in cell wall biosynthesis